MRALLPVVLAPLALAGCGAAVEPRAPYDDPAAVPVPHAVTAQVDLSRGLVVTWSATPADRVLVDGWIVERRTTVQGAFTRLSSAPQRDTTYADGDVGDGVRVVYRVFAVTAAGVAGAAVETAPVRADLVAPVAPTGITAATAPGGIDVAFTPGPEADLALFEVRWIEIGTTAPPMFRAVAGSPARLTGLVAGATYAVDVAAIDSAGRASPYGAPPATAIAGP